MNLCSFFDSVSTPPTRLIRLKFGALLAFLFVSVVAVGQSVHLKDRSDWWSINNESFRGRDVKPRSGNIAAGTFEIAGVDLDRDQFKDIAVKMGKAAIVERGDASTGRQQVCYTAADTPRAYLIFEFGANESVFYLFTDGTDWNGQRLCVRTKQLLDNSATSSGLRLGIMRAAAEAILGKADIASDNRLIYSREVRQKTSPTQFETLRKDYPEHLSDKVAHEKFDFYSVAIYVEARFGKSGLNYLAVSKSGELR